MPAVQYWLSRIAAGLKVTLSTTEPGGASKIW